MSRSRAAGAAGTAAVDRGAGEASTRVGDPAETSRTQGAGGAPAAAASTPVAAAVALVRRVTAAATRGHGADDRRRAVVTGAGTGAAGIREWVGRAGSQR